MIDGKLTFLRPANLAFVRATGPYPESSKQAWARLLEWLDKAGHVPVGLVGYGMALDDPRVVKSEDLRYDACVIKPTTWTSADAEIVRMKNFDGGAYLLVRRIGSYADLGAIVSNARNEMVPRSGLLRDDTRALVTINYSYPDQTEPSEQIADICIPVIPDRRENPRRPH